MWSCFLILSLRKCHFQCQGQTYLFCRCESRHTLPCLIHEQCVWWMRRVSANELSVSNCWAALRCTIELKSCYLYSDLFTKFSKQQLKIIHKDHGDRVTKLHTWCWSIDSHIYQLQEFPTLPEIEISRLCVQLLLREQSQLTVRRCSQASCADGNACI